MKKIAEKDETIQEFQAEKQALIQKIVDLEQKVKGVSILETSQLRFSG